MTTPPLTDEQLREAVAAFRAHGENYSAAAREVALSENAFRNRIKRAAERGMLPTKPVMPGFRISRTAHTFDGGGKITSSTIQQKPELGPEFELPEGQIIKGVSALLDADGRTIQKWVKTRTDATLPDLVAALKETFSTVVPCRPVAPPVRTDRDSLSVYPIADQHNGLLAWGRETGASYDLKIGMERLRDCTARLVAKADPSERALILNLGDWQHTDDQKNMTPRSGNILDVDSRYFKILTAGVRLMRDVIELALQKHKKVLVRNLPGNHDPHASVALTVALSAFYANNPRVEIDDDPSETFFLPFGATLIGATHGHRMKPDRMAMMMAAQNPEAWGATKYRWMLFGHIHHETVKEVGPVRCESFQTLSEKDAHHAASGYTSGRSLNCITLHREQGEIGRHRVNVPPPPSQWKDSKSVRFVGN